MKISTSRYFLTTQANHANVYAGQNRSEKLVYTSIYNTVYLIIYGIILWYTHDASNMFFIGVVGTICACDNRGVVTVVNDASA